LPHKYAKIIMRYCASGERRALVPFVENPEELLLQPEHERLEFKSTLRWDLKMAAVSRAPEKMVLKTIAAFLNSNGGQLVIGVGDGGEIVGLEHDYKSLTRHGRDGFENHFTHIFNSAIGAEFRQFVKLRFKEVQGKEICIVNVEPAPHPVFARLDGSTEEFYVRTGNSTTPLKLSEAASYLDLWRSRLG
jgi:predicted HTH transcriptional regulator